jgi:hypothetical protein
LAALDFMRRTAGDAYYRAVARCRPIVPVLSPRRVVSRWITQRQRAATDEQLAKLGENRPRAVEGPVLVDGMWDNPNFWVRYGLLRAALGLANGREIGLVGENRGKECALTFRRLNVDNVLSLEHYLGPLDEARNLARALLADTTKPADILDWKLPFDFPAMMLYDSILRKQRTAEVDLNHGRIEGYVTECIRSLFAADTVLRHQGIKLVVLSHAINYTYGSLAWRASQLGIPAVVLFGRFGVNKFFKVQTGDAFFDWLDRPFPEDFARLSEKKARRLADIGHRYLALRRQGLANDIGSAFAYQKPQTHASKAEMCRRFGWSEEKPLVTVYFSNWFDYPHDCGMTEFRDVLDWTVATLSAIENNRAANWLLRAHPCDEWYQGVTLSDLVDDSCYGHIKLSPAEWNNASVQENTDAVVTYHGTIGVEAAAIGKPVLVAGRGWYHDVGFVVWPKTREEFLTTIGRAWWKDIDTSQTTRLARIFAGWFFCCPDWQSGLILEDDSRQDSLYATLPSFLNAQRDLAELEIKALKEWYVSDHPRFHTFKMMQTADYAVTNISQPS